MVTQLGYKLWESPNFVLAGLNLAEPLLAQPPPNGDGSQCYNRYHLDQHIWSEVSRTTDKQSKWPILNHLAAVCKIFKIYACKSTECVRNLENLKRLNVVPESTWNPFRERILQIISCQRSVPLADRDTRAFKNFASAINCFYWILDSTWRDNTIKVTGTYLTNDDFTQTDTIDVFPVCEIIYWAVTTQIYFGHNPDIFGEGWKKAIIPIKAAAKAIADATKKASGNICLNRLWNITLISERAEQDIPSLINLAIGERYAKFRHPGHENCTPEQCDFNSLDATRVTQLHQCPETDADCRTTKFYFDPALLKVSIESGGGTTWSIDVPFRVIRDQKYIAISHVWADGTGIGLEPAGRVNACLFEYFARMARALECKGIWWDTISIPTDPKLRSKAINEMHNNYSNAQFTVLHDRYLANFEWADDGTPCLAVILSPWFTRGWTALECIMSRRIKVIFKKPGSTTYEPILKDLDEEVLAQDPSRCSRGHWIASTIIRRLRQPNQATDDLESSENKDIIQNVSDLLAVLQPRSTSWSRDRMIIAGLLAGVEVQYGESAAAITQRICQKLKYINPVSLVHEKTPIAETGAWSWCPKFLYDMPASPPSDFHGRYHQCLIRNGAIKLSMYTWYRRVTKEDVLQRRIIPFSTHPSVSFKIDVALEEEWHNCLILELTPMVALLVATIEDNKPISSTAAYLVPQGDEAIVCRHIGSVRVVQEKSFHERLTLNKSKMSTFIIGPPEEFPETPVRNNLQTLAHVPQSQRIIQNILKWDEQVWIGDCAAGELFVPKRIKERLSFGHFLEVAMHEVEIKYNIANDELSTALATTPCFAISGQGLIQKVSKAWSLETPLYSLVGVGLRWPPPSIPSAERVERRGKILERKIIEYPTNSFMLEFENDTLTYSAITKEYIEPSETRPYQGIWACISPSGAYELHLFQQPEPEEIMATKITRTWAGPPAGSPVFRAEDIENQLLLYSNREIDCDISLKADDDDSPKWTSRFFHFVDHNTINMVPDPDFEEEEDGEEQVLWKYRRIPSAVFFPPENTRCRTPPPRHFLHSRYQ
ncbi:hypothetical protein TWF703_004614 [Orbilia oligospora]|uniref:Heterokaryon incompatibility domain-containing protein n=2 Tax=Orbilia oligospora TaxID=2813651 RepID=A0A7C8NZV5_ORBOL|nr:hypothetical protein TWF703_004614 [Orbilia oligospora]